MFRSIYIYIYIYIYICVCVCVCVFVHTHTTDDNGIRPHTVQKHNKRTSMEFNLVTAQNTAHEPPEDGRIYMDRNM